VTVTDQPIPLRLKPSRHFPFLARHPWVHAHALAEDGRDLTCGQVVDLLDHDGNWVGRGLVNPASRLRIRLYAFDSSIDLGPELWATRIDAATERRRLCGPPDPDGAERLIFSESDLISGVIVDRYADCLSVQFTSAALMRWKDAILDHLQASLGARAVMVRVDAKTAKHEGIEPIEDWYRGVESSAPVLYRLNGLQLAVDLRSGQKTGGYLDQRFNHAAAAGYMSGRRVLDVCCYSGGFGLVAAKAGAAGVVGIDSSEPALTAARQAAERNGIESMEFHNGDCFDELKRLADAGEKFDAVVLDPPRFAGSRHQIDNALRAYTRLNASAIDLLPSGGILVTCSCSGRVSRSDFLNMLLDVGRRRRRDLIVMENRGPAPDHPVAISCPESDYLKCVIAQVC
jgi:23S rRNA (cytosine1962-C5)-methyltransferase